MLHDSVAIIIPAFNAAAYVAEAIDSALAQTRAAALVIVVDDGSTDETARICAGYNDAVICISQQNSGVSSARNHGALLARAEWLLFLDADDRLVSTALERMLAKAHAEEREPGVIYGPTIYFDERSGRRFTHANDRAAGAPPAGTLGNFWKSAITSPGAALIRSSLLREIGGFDPRVNSLADRQFWIKAGVLAPFAYVNDPVLEKRVHGENMSGNLDRALYQAALVQLGFLHWAQDRGIDIGFLRTSREAIIDNVLQKALDTVSLRGVEEIVTLAEEHGIHTGLLETGRRYAHKSPQAARLQLRLGNFLRQLRRRFSG